MKTPEEYLIESVLSGKCVLFLGAGASASSFLKNGETVPIGNRLSQILYKEFYPNESYDGESLQLVSSTVQQNFGNAKLHSFLYDLLCDVEPSEGLKKLTKFKWYNIYTTNIEQAIENAYLSEQEKAQNLLTVVAPYDKGTEDRNTEITLHKLHGCITRKDIPLVFSLEEYASSREAHLKLFEKLSIDLMERPIIFIGYSMQDSNFQEVWATIEKYCHITTIPNRYFFVSPHIKTSFAGYLASKGFNYFKIGIDDFAEYLIAKTKGQRESLEEFYSKNITPIEIFNNITTLNEENKYNLSKDYEFPLWELKKAFINGTAQFYDGAEPQWKHLKNNLDAPRDILQGLITDFDSWYKSPQLGLWIITGRSGDGKSTLLKRLSIELSNKAGETVLFANSRSDLDPKILLDLHKELNIPLVILIDNIADRIGKLNKLLSFFKNNGAKILIIGASRSSDWNLLSQESILAKHKEYPMGKLSDFEIPAILNKLKINNCLGPLTGIDELEQINIFKSYSERELIVALREITTGKKFDDIIANEYFSIKSSLAQQAYKYICIVNQYRYRIPQSLLLRIIGVDLSQVQEILFKFTEGIISYEETKDKDDYLISARHSVIASVIVRLFCKNDVEKYEFLESIVKAAIPSNPLEKSLVKKLYHHSTVSSFFSSEDVGVKSYDLLSGQLPGDSFLLQQKALFLCGIGRFDDAKATIDSALEMNPTSQIFKNTQGTIYLKESLNEIDFTKSSYLRDKGKDILLGAIRKSSRSYYKTSPYHYHSLISHLINWYKKFTPGSGEGEQLLEEIQKLMEEATREQPNDSAILVEAGRLQEILVNNPVAKGYFNRALELNPRNMSARFLLSRILMAEKEFNHAYKVCSEGVLLKEDEILLNRLRFELMHKLNMDFETIKSEYAKYTQTVPEDVFIKLCYAAYLYINNDDQCTDIFVELRNNSTLNHKEKHETMRVERIMNIHYLRESGYVIASTPAGYLCKTERFDTRTTFYCHRRFVNNVHENTRIESVTRFTCQGPLSKVARVIR